jgi:hypothetical protein
MAMPVSSARAVAILLVAACVATGCGEGREADVAARGYQIRDSAGVTVVDNHAPEWNEETAWTLSSAPSLSIGAVDGPEAYQLFQVRAARRLASGEVLIANQGTSELRFYDAEGRHLWSAGREGDGPGEFRAMRGLWSLGPDSVLVSDQIAGRLSVLTMDGALARVSRLAPLPDAQRPTPVGLVGDGLLVQASRSAGIAQPYGTSYDSLAYARYALDGSHARTLLVTRGRPYFKADVGGGRWVSTGLLHFPSPVAATDRDGWYSGTGDRWEIERYSPEGSLTHVIRRDEPKRPYTGDDVTVTFFDETVSLPVPELLPAYRALVVGEGGSLWVERYTLPDEQPVWSVFREDGRYLGDVETPVDAELMHVGGDFLLFVQNDDLGVERVVVHELTKPGRP